MKPFRIHKYLFQGLLLAALWTYSTAVGARVALEGDHAGFSFDVVEDKANTENKNGIVEIEGPNLQKTQALQLITKNLEDLTKKNPTKAQQFVGALTVAREEQIPQIVSTAFDKASDSDKKQISAAIIAQFKAGGENIEKTKFFKENLIAQATKASNLAGNSSQAGNNPAAGGKPGAGAKPSQTNPDGTPKTPEQIAAEELKAEKDKKEAEARAEAQRRFEIGQALAQQQAFQQAAQQAQAAQNAKNGGGGGGSGSGGGSGGGGGGGSGGGAGGGNDLPQGQSIGDKLQKHNDNTPSLSQLRSNFPDFNQNNSRGASDDKKKEESPFKVGSDSKKSSESDYSSKLKSKKEMDDKAKALTDASVQDPAAGLPTGGSSGNVKGLILQGKSNVPQSLPGQWSGGGSNSTFDASFGGGGDGGFGGGKVGGGGKGGGGGGEGGFGMDVGKGEPFSPEPAIKKIAQELISGGAGSGDGGEGDEVDGGGGNNNYTSDRAMKNGSGLLVNQIVLTRDNPKVQGRGIMAYTGIISQMCVGSEGRGMAVCEKTASETAGLSTKK